MEREEITTSFACQRCCQPLKIHSSFSTIDDTCLSELSENYSPGARGDNGDKTKANCAYDALKTVPPLSDSNGNGFLVVGDMPSTHSSNCSVFGASVDSLNHHLRITSRLFDILSDQSEVDHPLCEECADFVIDQMDYQLKVLEDECKDYREFLESMEKSQKDGKNSEEDHQKSLDELREQIKSLKLEEAQLISELKNIEKEQNDVEDAIMNQKQEIEKLNEEENRYWNEYNFVKLELFKCDDESLSIENQLRYTQTHLGKLKKTTIFNATFHIWHDGQFGTINGFRLGRLPNVLVEWSEINAAWGQAVLLLHSLAKKMNLTFKRYKLVPYGNHSFIECSDDKSKELPLYSSGGFRFFWNTKFDQAMVAFLDCLQQVQQEMLKKDSLSTLPYPMDKGKIEDTKAGTAYSIKIQLNSEEEWTRALRYMLTNLKWILYWVTNQEGKGANCCLPDMNN